MTSPQTPLQTGFDAQTTAAEVIGTMDLRGKIAIVTGGYSGIGLETTRVLAQAGATVIVPARTPDKARQALMGLPQVEQEHLDLTDPVSVNAFATRFLGSGRPLHLLINNAGIMATPLMRDARGFEAQFSANHLGHFQLAARLLPALRRAGQARLVSVSSAGHRFSGVDFDDPNFEHREYDKWRAYGQSKSANILFALALDRRGEAHGIRAFSLHPGRILDTDLLRHLEFKDLRAFNIVDEQGNRTPSSQHKTPAQGAATNIWCALSPQLAGMGGVYCANSNIAPLVEADSTDEVGLRPWGADAEAAERLWTLSERLTNTPFTF